MLNKKTEISVANEGNNQGVMAGSVGGSIDNSRNQIFVLPERQKIMPSIISKIVEVLADLTILPEDELDRRYKIDLDDLKPYNVPNKITHNNVIKYKAAILEFSLYSRICDEAFNIVDNHVIGSKSRILRDIKDLYNIYKGQLLLQHKDSKIEEIEIVRQNADYIIDMVKDELKQRILSENSTGIFQEDIGEGLTRVVCYAFEQCKILEKP